MEDIEKKLKEEFKESLNKLGVDLEINDIVIEHSKVKEHGDFATNVAMRLAKVMKKAPVMIANDIINVFDKDSVGVEKLEVAGPGFINVFLKNDSLVSLIKRIKIGRAHV